LFSGPFQLALGVTYWAEASEVISKAKSSDAVPKILDADFVLGAFKRGSHLSFSIYALPNH
jgi:hypothetical protein